MNYHVRFVHKVDSSARDTMHVELEDGAFNTRVDAGQALRNAGVIGHGCSVREMRANADGSIVVFPICPGLTTYWHSIILTPEAA